MLYIADAIHDVKRLEELRALPLERKIQITQTRIIEWYQHYHGNVCVSFSGGKDSTVLLHIARKLYPEIPAVFSNTGLEYPEIQQFVKSWDNVDIVVPQMRFNEVISTYGYPLIGKEVAEAIYYARKIRVGGGTESQERGIERYANDEREHQPNPPKPHSRGSETFWKRVEITGRYRNSRKVGVAGSTKSQFNKEKWLPLTREAPFFISHYCCYKMKKSPIHKYLTAHKYKPILATLAEESRIRKQAWIRHGCNAFESKNPSSQPMSFWTEQDILAYIVKYNLPIASVYGNIVNMVNGDEHPSVDMMGNIGCNLKCTGCKRTGCIFCGFGLHLEKGETRLQSLSKTHPRQYEYSIGGGQWADNPYYDATAPEYDGEWKNWNPKKIWVPSKKGLGMGKVFDMVNEIYGKDFYRYE